MKVLQKHKACRSSRYVYQLEHPKEVIASNTKKEIQALYSTLEQDIVTLAEYIKDIYPTVEDLQNKIDNISLPSLEVFSWEKVQQYIKNMPTREEILANGQNLSDQMLTLVGLGFLVEPVDKTK